jgi:hypothetical protein
MKFDRPAETDHAMTSSDAVDVELADDERPLFLSGAMEYGGPAEGPPILAPWSGQHRSRNSIS